MWARTVLPAALHYSEAQLGQITKKLAKNEIHKFREIDKLVILMPATV